MKPIYILKNRKIMDKQNMRMSFIKNIGIDWFYRNTFRIRYVHNAEDLNL
jgi:hypothetical protein